MSTFMTCGIQPLRGSLLAVSRYTPLARSLGTRPSPARSVTHIWRTISLWLLRRQELQDWPGAGCGAHSSIKLGLAHIRVRSNLVGQTAPLIVKFVAEFFANFAQRTHQPIASSNLIMRAVALRRISTLAYFSSFGRP